MKKLASLLLTLIAVIISISCEIGLGSSVDTDPPSVSIESPEVDSIIRDSFAIRGSWSDDGSIKRLTVRLKNTRTEGAELVYEGELEENAEKRGSGSWSVLINPKDSEGGRAVADGSYQATVEIEDMMGRITSQSTTFTVDNTAPVIVLTRPSTEIGSAGADTYGQTFSLEGQAADTNNVSLIEVEIYKDKECTQKQHTVKLYEVPNSINLDVAKFEKDNTENDYYKIYEETDTDKGAKTFYCKIVAYDGAQRYPADGSEQSEDDKKGNRIDSYYLYKDIATAIFTNYQLKITEVYSILNGTYTEKDTSRSAVSDSIKELLEKSRKTTGKFRLDPKNNPTYSVTGRSPLNLDGEDFKGSANNISNGQKVVIEVSPGLDGILLEKESLKVYAAECDARGNIIGEKIYPTLDEDQPAESGNSYRFTTPVTLADGFKIGHDYLWGVEGYDQSEAKNRVECAAKAYGFHMATSGKAPELTVTEPVKGNTYIGRGGSQKFSGKVKVEAGSPVVTIYRKYTENGEVKEEAVKSFSYTESEGKETDSELEYEFTYTVESFGNESAQFDYVIKAEQDGLVTSAERTIIYDMDPPKISMLGSSPSTANILKYDRDHEEADPEGGYVNGKVVFTFAVADDFDVVEECTYSVVRKSDGAVLSGPVKMENPTREEVTLDTQGIADGTQILLVIEAKDRSANRTVSGDEVNPTEYAYTVDQETDKPVLLPGDAASITLTKINSREAYDSQSGTKKNLATIGSTLQFRLHDDDGLKGVKIRNSAAPVTFSNQESVEWTDYTVQNLSGTDTTFSYTLPTEGGLYKFEAVVTDKNGLTNEYKFVINAVKPAAEISQITSEAKKGSTETWEEKNISSAALRNTFSIEESEGPYTLYRMINSGSFPNELPASSTAEIFVKADLTKGDDLSLYDGDAQFKDSLEVSTLTEGVNTIYYLIKDGNGRKGSIKFTQVIRDTTLPAVTINDIESQDKYISSKNFKFNGTVTEANLQTIKAGLRKEDGSPVVLGNGQQVPDETLNPAVSGGNTYEWTYRMDDLADGSYKVNIKAQDKAWNQNESNDANGGYTSQKCLVVDTTDPVITMSSSTALKDGNGNDVTQLLNGGTYYVAGGFTLSGSITETNTDTISLKDGNTVLTFTTGGNAAGSWSYEQSESNGLHAYSLRVKDKAGNESEFKVNITIDTAGPTVNEITNPADNTRKGENSLTDSTYIFRGNVHDNEGGTGVAKIFYAFTTDATAPEASAYTQAAASNGEWSIVKTIETGTTASSGNLHEGKWKLYVKVQDKAGNISGVTVREFDLDKNPPVLTESHSADFGFKNTQIDLGGTASDSYGLKSVVITEEGTSFSKPVTVNAGGSWSETINPADNADNLSDGEHTFTITAEDNIGKKTILTRKVTFDHQDPTVSFNTPLPSGQSYGSASEPSAVTFSGSAQDAGASGLEKVQIKFSDESHTSGWLDATVTGTIWTYTLSDLTAAELSGVFSEEGTKTVNIKAKDRAGNETEEIQGTTIYDRHDPSVSDVKYKTSATDTTGEDLTSGAKKYRNTGSFILEGSYSDNLTGVIVSVMKNGTELSPGLLDTSVSGKWKITETSIADDSYTYVITAKDSSGRTATFTVPLVVDTIKPSVGFGIDSVSEAEYNRGTYQFSGSVTDANLNGSIKAGLLRVAADGSESAVDGWQNKTVYPQKNTEENGYDWTFFVNDLAEGKYKVQIDAEDEAGNQNADDNKKSSKLLIVDTTLPVINAASDGNIYTMEGIAVTSGTDLNSASDEYFAKGSFTLSGSVTDSYFKSVTIKEGEAELASVTSQTSATGEWSFNYTHTQGTTQDGLHTYTVTAEDKAGNRSVRTIKVTVDTTAPATNSISSPDDTRTLLNAISDNSFIFSGTASDAEGGTGAARIWYAFTKTEAAPGSSQQDTTGYESITANDGSTWNLAKTINTNATDVTSVTTGNLSEGNWYLHVKAQDKAGNVSAATTVHFDIDKASPSSEVSIDGNKDKFNRLNLDSDLKGSITINGTASDTFGLDTDAAVTLYIYKDGEQEAYKTVPVSEIDETTHSWTKQFVFGSGYGDSPSETNYLPEGSYEIKAEAKDKVGKKTMSASRTFVIDYTLPVISVTNADSAADAETKTWYKGSGSTYISGTATENGSGIASMQIKIDGADSWSPLPPQAGWTHECALGSLSENTDEAESIHTIAVKITDKAGNVNAENGEVFYFRHDKAEPSLSMTSDNENINGLQDASITISGTVSDGGTRPVKTLVLTAKKDGSDYTFTQGGSSQTSISSSTLTGNYSYTLNGEDLEEGSYVFTLTASDYAGQTAVKSVNAVVDKTLPSFTKITVGSGDNVQDITSTSDNSVTDSGTTRWYKSQTQSIAVYASDALSGIETVEYRTASASSSVTDANAEWQPLTKKSETGPGNTTIIVYRGTAAFSDEASGSGSRLHIRVTDKAGNTAKFYTNKTSETSDDGTDYVVFNIDTSKPALALSKVQIGSNAAKATAGTEYINSKTENTLTLYGTYSNNISGVAGLNFYKNNTETALSASSVEYYAAPLTANTAIESLSYAGYDTITDKNSITAWKAVFANASLPEASGDIIVRGESVAGVSSGNLKLFTLNRDNTKPQLNNITITADDVNHTVYKKTVGTTDYYYLNNTAGTYRITAQAEDNTGTSETSASGVYNVTLNIPGITPDKNSASAQFTDINLSGISGKGSFADPLTVKLTITDNAGNTEDYTRNIVFDTTAPSAVHEPDDKNKDLYFRVGSSDNTDNKGISTGDAAFNDAKDKDVGGKYGSNTYGNDTTIKLRGKFADEENGSGVKAIHYMVYQEINKPADTFGVIPENATEAQIATALSDALSIKNNGKSFTLSADSTRRVFYNVKATDGHDLGGTELAGSASDGYSKYYKEITTNFFESLSGFVSGSNYLVLAAEDNVGNIKIDVIPTRNGDTVVTSNKFSLNVDQTKPDIQQKTGFEFSKEHISNAAAPQILEFNILEAASGIEGKDFSGNSDFTVTLGSTTLNVEAAQSIPLLTATDYNTAKTKNLIVVGAKDTDTNLWPVSLQIGTAALGNAADGSKPSVTVTVKDKATNASSPTQIGIMKMDKTAPVPSISKPAADATVNKTITVTGKIEEVNDVSSVTFTAESNGKTVVYSYPALQTVTESAKALTFSNTTKEWSAVIDTTEFYNGTESKPCTLTLTATDSAGNVYDADSETDGNQALTRSITIDQNSDRPVIKLSQIDSSGNGLVKVKTMFGTVDDDDKNDDVTVNKLWLWQKQEGKNGNAAPTAAPSYNAATQTQPAGWTVPAGWLEFGKTGTNSSLDNNSWQLESDEKDGNSTWYWAVADTNNKVFWTLAVSQLERPYIVFKGETAVSDNTTGLSFRYDTVAPEITKIEFLRLATDVYKSGTTRYAASEISQYITDMNDAGENINWVSDDNYVFGKDKALMYIKAEVKEETGMAEWNPTAGTGPLALEGFDSSKVSITSALYNVSGPDSEKKYTYIIGPVDLHGYNLDENAEGYPKLTLKFRALDAAGKSTERTKSVIIDNKASITMEKITPSPLNETSGEFTFRSQVSDRESSVADVKFYIPQYGQTIPSSPDSDSYSWTEVDDLTSIQISIEFTDFNSILDYKTTSGGAATVDAGFLAYDIGGTGANAQGVYNVPVWFKVIDEVGNIGYVQKYVIKDKDGNIVSTNNDIRIKYNPNTDRPKVYITSPEIPAGASYVEKGGRIKISGSAEDNEGIAGVYLQFAVGEDGDFAPTLVIDENGTPSAGGASTGEAIPGTTLRGTKANNTKNWNYTLNVKDVPQNQSPIIKIRAIAVDIDETNGQNSSAWSDVLTIKVDNSMPSFGSMKLVNDATSAEIEYQPGMYIKGNWTLHGTVSTTSDWMKSLSIEEYTWSKDAANGSGSWATEGTHTGAYSGSTVTATDAQTFSFTIPVSVSDTQTEWTVEIEATDGSENASSNTETPQINIDNTAPQFADYVYTTDSTATVKDGRQIRLYQDTYGPAGRMLDTTSNFLQNSNGAKFTLAGKVIEPASGFEKAVFYIERRGKDGETRIYNFMEGHGTDNMANRTNIASTSTVDANHPVYINDDGLPVKTLTVTRSSSESLANDEIKTNLNIRHGGLVYIGGLYRTITAVDRDKGTVTIDPTDEALNHTSAQFVYAMVVDSTGEGENSNGTIRESDGDGLLESYSGSQTANYRWEATFDSSNIPDGPVYVHVVLFDQAGNISHGYAVTRASNNAPRITKVMIGTDLNGNGKYDFGSGEFSTFYAQKDDNNNPNTKTGKKAWKLDTSEEDSASKLWKVKSGLAVIPEFVGGAGPFYYNFSTGEAEIEEAQKISSNKSILTQDYLNNYKLKASGANDLIKQSGTDTNATWTYSTHNGVSNAGGSLTLTNKQITGKDTLTNDDDADEIFYRFTFWDSTDDSTPGFDTGSTILNLKVEQDLTDGNEPDAKIKPFTWSGTGFTKTVTVTQNNVEQSSNTDVVTSLETGDILGTKVTTDIDSESGDVTVTKTVITPKNSIYGASLANGHIELERDLPDDILYGTDDPKVSGKITFHGTAKDDTRLSSIWFNFDGFTPASDSGLTQTTEDGVTLYDASTTALNGYTQAAWYNPATASWVNAPARMESYTTGTGENVTTVAASHWEFTVSDSSFDQNGHEVDWYLSIDTAYIENTVGLNKALSVISLDAAGSHSATSTDQTTSATPTPYYSMDVVPYVTSLTTSLSGFQSGNPSVYDRTALGHYPVYMTHAQGNGTYTYETIEVNGFNLYGTKMKFENVNTAVDIDAYKEQATNGTYPAATSLLETKHYRLTIPADVKTGKIVVWSDATGTIKSLNNCNDNDAKGDIKTGSTITENGGYTGCYNRQANGINNNRLTDDLEIDVWDFNSEAAKAYNDTKADNAVMKINPVSGMIGFAFSNGSERFSMGGKLGANGNEYSYHEWNMSFDMMNYNYLAYDTNGNAFATTAGGDINNSKPTWDFYSFMSDRWGQVLDYTGNITDHSNKNSDSGFNPQVGAYNICVEGIGQINAATINGNFIRKDRIQSTSIATLRHDENDNDKKGTYIYLAYYDFINDEIRYRFCDYLDSYDTANQSGADWGTFTDVRKSGNQSNGRINYSVTATSGQIVATNTTKGDYARSKTL